MAKFIKYGETIEGDSIGIQVRKWVPSTIVFLASVKKRMFRYSSSRNSTAIIQKEHVVSDDPEVVEATKGFHRNIGDELECFGMKVYVDSNRKIKTESDEGATHTHGAIFATTDKHTIATISTPLACLQKAIADKEQQELAIQKQKQICEES